MASKSHSNRVAANRKALRDYQVVDRHEARIELRGTEVKSVRGGEINLKGAYARVENGELVLYQMNIALYAHGNRFNHDPERPRRLLMHRREIGRLQVQTEQKGLTLIPLSVYMKRGKVKVELGVCRGKRQEDKRETLKRKTADREAARAIARQGR